MTPTLSILTFTLNGSDKLKRVLPGSRRVADELVVAIDDTTSDDSEEIARRFADRVISLPHNAFLVDGKSGHLSASELSTPQCTGDWILRLDHDETIGPSLTKARLRPLLADRWVTHYWLPRRWAVTEDLFISSSPWSVDYQMRLYRNLPSLMKHPRQQHDHNVMLGECGYLTHDWLVHWDLAWHSRKNREEKIRFYESLAPYTGAEFYLHEDQRYDTLPLDYIPPSPALRPNVPPGSEPFGCVLGVIDFPSIMRSAQRYCVLLSIQNLSNRVFHPSSQGIYGSNIQVSYHWYRESNGKVEEYAWEQRRSPLAKRLGPTEGASTYLWVNAPCEPGRYWLQPDLVEENVAWASQSVDIARHLVEVKE